jgi:hypothetical protein
VEPLQGRRPMCHRRIKDWYERFIATFKRRSRKVTDQAFSQSITAAWGKVGRLSTDAWAIQATSKISRLERRMFQLTSRSSSLQPCPRCPWENQNTGQSHKHLQVNPLIPNDPAVGSSQWPRGRIWMLIHCSSVIALGPVERGSYDYSWNPHVGLKSSNRSSHCSSRCTSRRDSLIYPISRGFIRFGVRSEDDHVDPLPGTSCR